MSHEVKMPKATSRDAQGIDGVGYPLSSKIEGLRERRNSPAGPGAEPRP